MKKVAVVAHGPNGIGFATSLMLAGSSICSYASIYNTTKSNAINDIAKKVG